MKGLIRLVVAGMMVAGVSVAVAQQAAGAAPAATPAPAVKAHIIEKTGVLSAPATNAVAGVLAVLTSKQHDKTFNLTATDKDVIAAIKAELAKAATVVVHGELSKDGTAIAVTKCQEQKAKAAAAK